MERKIKYVVMKHDDIRKYLPPIEQTQLEVLMLKVQEGRLKDRLPLRSYVVVQDNWKPEYEQTWALIEQRVNRAESVDTLENFVREIHKLLKRGETTEDHGLQGNMACIKDAIISLKFPLEPLA